MPSSEEIRATFGTRSIPIVESTEAPESLRFKPALTSAGDLYACSVWTSIDAADSGIFAGAVPPATVATTVELAREAAATACATGAMGTEASIPESAPSDGPEILG